MSAGIFIFWMAISVAGALLFLKYVVDGMVGITQRLAKMRKKLDV